ncbi:alpha/beta hydrolase [Liquorilactobacillus uvarum]|uniref:alpha/beta hydrolase n=1 Tax=Liquorilactobacillus uvarum TaxID=303240 RepID=UPI00288AF71A|nr:phospholipase [Liquorilactobacillus uvarum]
MDYRYELLYPKEKVEAKTPIVITMHGMGSNFYDLRPLLGIFETPVIQLHIQGNIPFGNGFAFFEPDFSQQTEEQVIGPVISAVYRQINAILIKEKIAKQPKFILGFSQGAILTVSLSLLYPGWLRGGIVLSGRLPVFVERMFIDKNDVKYPEIFVSQGEKDPLFAPQTGQHLTNYLQKHGYNVFYRVYPIGHGVHRKTVSDLKNWLRRKV